MAISALKTIFNLYVILWTVVKTSICFGSDFESYLEAQVIISVYLAVPNQSIYMHLEVWCCITYYGAWDLNLYDYRMLLIKHFRIQISGLR